jgi:2-oxo-3-hexenedioate decarboxylase
MNYLAACAQVLLDAEAAHQAIHPLTTSQPGLSVDDGYAIQRLIVHHKIATGARLAGAKAGLTSKAKQTTMGIDVPIFGWLTDAMALPYDEPLDTAAYIHPRAEPEIVFILGRELRGPRVDIHDVLAATDAICCGLEILDSRYRGYKFTLPDVVADNSGAAGFVLGPRRVSLASLDLTLLACVLEVNGRVQATATGAAVLGHPAQAVAALANHLATAGQALQPGWKVLSGGMTDAVPLAPEDHVRGHFAHLGSVGVRAR